MFYLLSLACVYCVQLMLISLQEDLLCRMDPSEKAKLLSL